MRRSGLPHPEMAVLLRRPGFDAGDIPGVVDPAARKALVACLEAGCRLLEEQPKVETQGGQRQPVPLEDQSQDGFDARCETGSG